MSIIENIKGFEKFYNASKKNIERIQDTDPEFAKIKMRNLDRLKSLLSNKPLFCPKLNRDIIDKSKCIFCEFGHITECHYPHRCFEGKFCNHYRRFYLNERGVENGE